MFRNAWASREPAGDFKVPPNVHYEVKTYREEKHPRAGQVGIAVAKEHMGKNKTLPVVVFTHGGGWAEGDKDQLAWQCIRYAQSGFLRSGRNAELLFNTAVLR